MSDMLILTMETVTAGNKKAVNNGPLIIWVSLFFCFFPVFLSPPLSQLIATYLLVLSSFLLSLIPALCIPLSTFTLSCPFLCVLTLFPSPSCYMRMALENIDNENENWSNNEATVVINKPKWHLKITHATKNNVYIHALATLINCMTRVHKHGLVSAKIKWEEAALKY